MHRKYWWSRLRDVLVFGMVVATVSTAASAASAQTALSKFAECVVGKNEGMSDALVRSEPGSPAETQALAALRDPRRICGRPLAQDRGLPDTLLYRGMLAEQLWAAKPGRLPDIAPGENDLWRIDFGGAFRHAGARQVEYNLAQCVVFLQPKLTGNLLRTVPGSSEEQTANLALRTVVAGCLPLGAAVKLDRLRLRALLTEQAYRTATKPSA